MKYICEKSIIINDHLVLYNANGTKIEIRHSDSDYVVQIHCQTMIRSGIDYNLRFASMPYGDKTIYYRYGIEQGYETDKIDSDFKELIDIEFELLRVELLFGKAKKLIDNLKKQYIL